MAIGMSVEAIRIGSQFDPLGDDYLADPYPFMAEARDGRASLLQRETRPRIVTRYPLIRQVFLNPQVFSAANANAPLRPACPAAVKALEEGGFERCRPWQTSIPGPYTGPTHGKRVVHAGSCLGDGRLIRDLVVRYCDERFRDEHADIVRDLAWELPVRVLFKILGIDEDRVAEIKEGSFNRILFVYGRTGGEAEQVRAAAGMATFWRYAEQLVEARTREPRDDFTSALVSAADERGERLSPQQAATVVLNLLFAGHELRQASSATVFGGFSCRSRGMGCNLCRLLADPERGRGGAQVGLLRDRLAPPRYPGHRARRSVHSCGRQPGPAARLRQQGPRRVS